MKIINVSKSDSGVYYCSMSGLEQNFHIAGTLIVTEQYPKKPTLSILSSVADNNEGSKSVVLLCVAFNWTKQWHSIEWTLNGTRKEGWMTLDSDGSLRSLLVMSETIQNLEITCYIKERKTGEMISSNFTEKSAGSDGTPRSKMLMRWLKVFPSRLAIEEFSIFYYSFCFS
ncbi:uncharacterized protein LOC130313961 isoform X2 [Hyla sarda]|uniref:uncharacterized protein LOC130313961 isoform X2 n=1 Tax=Hyla sarda TaxID=327740 RepID=UPI0024C2BCF2|nr:uncharacterized protein LOC130313961 isoform X2 [Hyla sarda]